MIFISKVSVSFRRCSTAPKMVNFKFCPYSVRPGLVLKTFVLDKKFHLYFWREFFVLWGHFSKKKPFVLALSSSFCSREEIAWIKIFWVKENFVQDMSKTKFLRTSRSFHHQRFCSPIDQQFLSRESFSKKSPKMKAFFNDKNSKREKKSFANDLGV